MILANIIESDIIRANKMKGDKTMKKAGNILLGIILIIIGLIIGGNALRNNSHRHIF